mmetsp:Transcript_69790/g.160416  ORF Transcript_69790/g.160416 Transcript_69790/m.160416 type:complete len:671 (-) Transcript_69790:53-2065(-)
MWPGLPCGLVQQCKPECKHTCGGGWVFDSLIPGGRGSSEAPTAQHSGQDHILAFEAELTEEEAKDLREEYDDLDPERLEHRFQAARQNERVVDDIHKYSAVPEMNWELKNAPKIPPGGSFTRGSPHISVVMQRRCKAWQNAGMKALLDQSVGAVVLAGGPDFEHYGPICTLNFGMLSQKSIMQLLCERLRRLQHLTSRLKLKVKGAFRVPSVPLFVITNEHNFNAVHEFVTENNCFGLDQNDVTVVVHASTPVVDSQGKILMRNKGQIWKKPGGTGMSLKAVAEEGLLPDVRCRGVTHLHFLGTNNVAAKILDPVFVGYAEAVGFGAERHALVKCTEKLRPDEPLGILINQQVKKGLGAKSRDVLRASILEPSEAPGGTLREVAPNNAGLLHRHGSMCEFYLGVADLPRLCTAVMENAHSVNGRYPTVDLATGRQLPAPEHPAEPNGKHLVHWLGDLVESCDSVNGFSVGREEYVVIKSETGPLSIEAALTKMVALHQQWVLDAGAVFTSDTKATTLVGMQCEVSPLVSYDGEGLEGYFKGPVGLPLHIAAAQEFRVLQLPLTIKRDGILQEFTQSRWVDETDEPVTARKDFIDFSETTKELHTSHGLKKETAQREWQMCFIGVAAREGEKMPSTSREDREALIAFEKQLRDPGPSYGAQQKLWDQVLED